MRPAIAALPGSQIREVANAGIGRPGVLAFWFGESDEITPAAVREAAAESLARGETFYSHNLGLMELRRAIADYASGLHRPVDAARVAVTSSGVNALMLAMQLLAGPGDRVAVVVPVWPNLPAQPAILGADVRRVPLVSRQGAWTLDLQRLLEAVTPTTRVLLVNAPNNPTGWTLAREEQQAILDHCRRTGTWIVADEVYERLWYGAVAPSPTESATTRGVNAEGAPQPQRAAPSFLDLADPDDRLVVAHSFSKSFLMTGWRLGWLVLPPACVEPIGKLIEFNTSCAPVFVQRGALAALDLGDAFVVPLVERLRQCRDRLVAGLSTLPRVRVAAPHGGMYAFLQVEGQTDSLSFAKQLVTRHGLGLAPGAAFGAEAEGWLRWCFASKDPSRLEEGLARLAWALDV
ncbi:MAG: pyridoxal phosphate-dependent aminotransferase [Aquincola sp.]|nr:pyridoxal phosphate-dependent aminotransferase [Aquincola sp.]MDH4287843.1 pyridoxal phosphate-dependent aminotransferase [Aquincola sp.]MDH5328774.1 pyridoxal phosphate-dependent aminotransferase [Aquincola sp.]